MTVYANDDSINNCKSYADKYIFSLSHCVLYHVINVIIIKTSFMTTFHRRNSMRFHSYDDDYANKIYFSHTQLNVLHK